MFASSDSGFFFLLFQKWVGRAMGNEAFDWDGLKKNCCDLNLGESTIELPYSVRFQDSGLYQLNSFDFYFDMA